MIEYQPYGFETEAWKSGLFLQNGLILLEGAAAAITGGEVEGVDVRAGFSYRMEVGGCFLTVLPADGTSKKHARGNRKSYEGSDDRQCSESICLDVIAKDPEVSQVAGFALVSAGDTATIRSVEGIVTPTVVPCSVTCEPELQSSPFVVSDIPFVTRDLEGRKSQAFTLSDLSNGYHNDLALLQGNTVSEFDFERAFKHYKQLINRVRNWNAKPSPASLAVESLMLTAA